VPCGSAQREAGEADAARRVAELKRLGISVQEVAVDGGFNTGPTNTTLSWTLRP
jgi:hypothetical protein